MRRIVGLTSLIGGGIFRKFTLVFILVIVIVISVFSSTKIWSVYHDVYYKQLPPDTVSTHATITERDKHNTVDIIHHDSIDSKNKSSVLNFVEPIIVSNFLTNRSNNTRAEKAKTKAQECGINFGTDIAYNITVEDLQILADTQKRRQESLMAYCENQGLDMSEDNWLDRAMNYVTCAGVRLQVNDEYKIITCLMPKCGTGSWRNVLLRIKPENDNLSCPAMKSLYSAGGIRNTAITPLSRSRSSDLRQKLKTYYKFTFVREPMERLLSAFMSKFGRDRASLWPLSKSYWWPVVDDIIKGTPGLEKVEHTNENAKNTPIDFNDFVNYYSKRKPAGFDQHWKPQTQLCDPCIIKYDFIGHMETLERDANYIIETATNIHERVHYPLVHAHKGHERAALGYLNISQSVINTFGHKHYKQDYSAYSYDFCETMRNIGKSC